MMKNYFKVLAASALATVGLLGIIPQAQAEPIVIRKPQYIDRRFVQVQQPKDVFQCVALGNNQFATVRQRVREITYISPVYVIGTEVLSTEEPMVVWTATLNSDNPLGSYTPESRCEAVSARLTNLDSSLGDYYTGGSANLEEISKLGIVNGQGVIFASYERARASRNNVVFTLKPANWRNSLDTLALYKEHLLGVAGTPQIIE